MAKITHPLHSLAASGSIGHRLTFSNVKIGSVVKNWSKPTDRKTAAQLAQRTAYQAGIADWKTLTTEQHELWNTTAQQERMTGFNLFMRGWLTPTPPAGTIWDSGTTTWDAGTTTWDT